MLEYSSFQENNITAKEREGIPGIVCLTRNGKVFFAPWRPAKPSLWDLREMCFPRKGLVLFSRNPRFGDLNGVRCGTFPDVVGDDPHIQAVFHRFIAT